MSEGGKCKRNRRHRGHRRKNKSKEINNIDEENSLSEHNNTPVSDIQNNEFIVEIKTNNNTLEGNDCNNSKLDESSKQTIEKEVQVNETISKDVLTDILIDNVSSFENVADIKIKNSNYRVDSPVLSKDENSKKKLSSSRKSKSLDNDNADLNITEVSEGDLKSDDEKLAESSAIISEAESDVEWEVADDLPQECKRMQKIKGQISIEAIPPLTAGSEENSSLSPQHETDLKNYLQSLSNFKSNQNIQRNSPVMPEAVASTSREDNEDIKSRRARKKAALEEHFLPQFLNPRVLDVIDEEGSSDSSESKTQPKVRQNVELQHRYDDVDDDVFVVDKVKEPKCVFPKSKDYFAAKNEAKRQQECLLVGAKIIETDINAGCGDWKIENIEVQRGADVVYLDDSSSSASEIDNEEVDVPSADERVTIKTPIIDFNSKNYFDENIPPIAMLLAEEYAEKRQTLTSVNDSQTCHTDNAIPKILQKVTSNEDLNESLESLLVPETVPAACNEVIIMANEFVDELPIVTEILKESKLSLEKVESDKMLNLERTLKSSELCANRDSSITSSSEEMSDGCYSRQDSSSSVCSSRSTSQSTAKYNPLSSSLTDIAAIVHDDLTSSPDINKHVCDSEPNNKTVLTADNLTLNNVTGEQRVVNCEDSKIVPLKTSPQKLREICVHKVAALPFGRTILEELAAVSKSLKFLTRDVLSDLGKISVEQKMPLYPQPDLSAVKKIAMFQNHKNIPSNVNLNKTPPPIAPRQSSFKVLREDPHWVGLPSQNDPTLLACLSPSQKTHLDRTKNIKNNDEAGELIDMHRKYFERRGYDETHANGIKSSPVSNNKDDEASMQTNGVDVTIPTTNSTNRLLAIIRDPQVNPDATVQSNNENQSAHKSAFDFMETLRSFESLNKKMEEETSKTFQTKKMNSKESLEVKESYSTNQSFKPNYRKPSEKSDNIPSINVHSFIPIDLPSNFSDSECSFSKEVKNDRVNGVFKAVSVNKSFHSTGNLTSEENERSSFVKLLKKPFMLDDPIFDREKTSKTSPTFNNGPRRSSLPRDIHDRQIEYIVQKEKEIEEQIRQLEERRIQNIKKSGPKAPMLPDDNENSYTSLPVPKYHISRQRDIATLQSEIKKDSVSNLKSERSNSMISLPSNAERFRDQMYFEYMDKFAEREERKQHKVIKITSSNSNNDLNSKDNSVIDNVFNDIKKNCSKIEEEFINKAKMRWDKLGIKDPETEDESESSSQKGKNDDENIATEKKPVVIEHKIKVMEGDEEKDVQKLPNHLQEFVKFTSSGDEAGESNRNPKKSDSSLFVVFVAMAVVVLSIGHNFFFGTKKLTKS